MAAKPGAETPTTIGTLARFNTCFTIETDSEVVHLRRFAELAQHRHAGHARLEEEIRHAIDRRGIDPAVGVNGVGAMT